MAQSAPYISLLFPCTLTLAISHAHMPHSLLLTLNTQHTHILRHCHKHSKQSQSLNQVLNSINFDRLKPVSALYLPYYYLVVLTPAMTMTCKPHSCFLPCTQSTHIMQHSDNHHRHHGHDRKLLAAIIKSGHSKKNTLEFFLTTQCQCMSVAYQFPFSPSI